MIVRNNWRYFNFYWLLIASLLLQGCVSIAKEIKSEQVAKIEIGKSTKEDVLAILGLPHKRELKTIEGDKKLEFWIYFKGSGRSTVFMLTGEAPEDIPRYATIFFSNTPISERKGIMAIVVFNEHEKVVDLKTKGE